jgi:hypothetical protein
VSVWFRFLGGGGSAGQKQVWVEFEVPSWRFEQGGRGAGLVWEDEQQVVILRTCDIKEMERRVVEDLLFVCLSVSQSIACGGVVPLIHKGYNGSSITYLDTAT